MLKTKYPYFIFRTLFHSIFCGNLRRFILVFSLFTSISLFASKPVTIIVSLSPPYTPFLHEYSSEGANQLQVSIIIYVARGDYPNATFSGISLVPIAGDAAGKGLKYTIKVIENSSSADKNAVGILRKIPVDQLTKFIKKIYSLPTDLLQRLFKEFIENPVLLEKVALNQKLVDSWKKLSKVGLVGLSKNIKALDYVDIFKSSAKLGDAPRLDYRKTFKQEAFPEIADKVHQVHHAVPKKVKNTFGKIDDAKLHSLENLRGIPKADKAFHQMITNKWEQWFIDNPNFSLDDALDYAKKIDDEFGHRFIPPVR